MTAPFDLAAIYATLQLESGCYVASHHGQLTLIVIEHTRDRTIVTQRELGDATVELQSILTEAARLGIEPAVQIHQRAIIRHLAQELHGHDQDIKRDMTNDRDQTVTIVTSPENPSLIKGLVDAAASVPVQEPEFEPVPELEPEPEDTPIQERPYSRPRTPRQTLTCRGCGEERDKRGFYRHEPACIERHEALEQEKHAAIEALVTPTPDAATALEDLGITPIDTDTPPPTPAKRRCPTCDEYECHPIECRRTARRKQQAAFRAQNASSSEEDV